VVIQAAIIIAALVLTVLLSSPHVARTLRRWWRAI
jgi:hypothetical protein